MSRVWSGLRSGLKFNCTACGKCCQNKRSNVSLNLSEVESMSAHLAIDKLTFLEKYTEEKVVDGQVLTKLAHKKDLTCVLLDVDGKECIVHGSRPVQCRSYPFLAENVTGEAEWKTESRKCEGIIIDKYFPSLGPRTNQESNENENEKKMKEIQNELENKNENENGNSYLERMLYDGVIPEYENTFHGSLNAYWRRKNLDGNQMESVVFTADKLVESANTVVLPDTIMRQMIIHEIHSEGLGPDWGYQDSVEYLLESESNSMEADSGNVLEDFKTEFCHTHFSKIIYEDKDNLLRVVDTTTPKSKVQELVLCLSGDCDSVVSEEKCNNYLLDFEENLIMNNHYINPNNQDNNDENNENENDENDDEIREIKILETKRRFEFINSDNLAQTEILFSTPDTPGLGGQNEKNNEKNENLKNENVKKSIQFDHSRLMMPVHQVLSVIGQRVLNDHKHDENNNNNNDNNNNNRNQEVLWTVIGAGGFSLPSHFTTLIPHYSLLNNIRIDAIEPESRVLDLAKEYFDAHFVTAQITNNGKETNMSGSHSKDSIKGESANVHAYETDGLSYLQNNKNKIDFLMIDAFEETPIGGFKSELGQKIDGKSESNEGEKEVASEGYFSNRAPPLDILSDIDLLVRNLKGKDSAIDGNSGNNGIQGVELDVCSGGMCGSGEGKRHVDVSADVLLENIFDKDRGGILAINIYGPSEWMNKVFNIINESSDLSPPVLVRIKGQKNVLLLSSRMSGESK